MLQSLVLFSDQGQRAHDITVVINDGYWTAALMRIVVYLGASLFVALLLLTSFVCFHDFDFDFDARVARGLHN